MTDADVLSPSAADEPARDAGHAAALAQAAGPLAVDRSPSRWQAAGRCAVLIGQIARENPGCGYKRIQGELLGLGIRVKP